MGEQFSFVYFRHMQGCFSKKYSKLLFYWSSKQKIAAICDKAKTIQQHIKYYLNQFRSGCMMISFFRNFLIFFLNLFIFLHLQQPQDISYITHISSKLFFIVLSSYYLTILLKVTQLYFSRHLKLLHLLNQNMIQIFFLAASVMGVISNILLINFIKTFLQLFSILQQRKLFSLDFCLILKYLLQEQTCYQALIQSDTIYHTLYGNQSENLFTIRNFSDIDE